MNPSISTLLLALVAVTMTGNALAQSACVDAPTRVIQAAVSHPAAPVMSHEVASIIKLTHQAAAQYRRTGKPQDLARVKVMREELASRGYGRATQNAPAKDPNAMLLAEASRDCPLIASAAE